MKLLSVIALLPLAAAQPVPLPNTPDVFLRLGSASAQVVLESHVDLLCPDCAAEWPVLKQLSAHYTAEQLQIVFHLFPLPYHTWAFTTAYTANVIASLNASAAASFAWLDNLFTVSQANYWNDVTAGNTSVQVEASLAQLAAETTGVSASAVLAGLQDPNLNENTRISWKFGCSRSVTGTPSFFINGLPVAGGTTLSDWTAILDPLFAPSAAAGKARAPLSGFVTPRFASRGGAGQS